MGRVAEELRGWRGEGPNHEGHGPATRARAGTSPVPHAGGTRGAVAQRDDALREVATPFSFHWVCVNDCGRRLWDYYRTVMCCRVSCLFRVILLLHCCVIVNTRFIHVPLNVLVKCSRFAPSLFLFIDSPSCFM